MKKIKQIQRVRQWMRLHGIVTGIVFGVYFLAAFLCSPSFFLSDVVSKFRAIADTITLTGKVLHPPVKPIVTLASTCDNGILNTSVDWADDENSYTYDVFRDGNPLVTNLTNTFYKDLNVSINSRHQYTVEAYGPMGDGFAVSDPVSVTTPNECAFILPTPIVTVTSLDSMYIASQAGIIHTMHQSFFISGTTNIPASIVSITITGGSIVSLQTTANANGYWEVLVPASLAYGVYTMTVSAVDTLDGTRTATQILSVQVDQVATEPPVNTPVNVHTIHHQSPVTKQLPVPVFQRIVPQAATSLIPVDFMIRNASAVQSVLQGDSLNIDMEMTVVENTYLSKPARVQYVILDNESNIISVVEKNITITEKGSHIYESVKIPVDLGRGNYTMQVALYVDTIDIVRTTPFLVAELPLFNLGSGAVITYPQFVRNLGWFVFGLLFSLLGWLLLWIREYWLYLHATRFITEKHLSKKGFIQKRKEVSS